MVSRLNIASYNCKHFRVDKYVVIKSLLVACEFVLLQEHCMFETKFIHKLKTCSINSECVVTSPMDDTVPLLGRPYGGCAIIWSSQIKCNVDKIECISKRICAVKITLDTVQLVLFNMYMPCDNGYDSTDLAEYCDVLNEVKHICNREATQYFILGGDMNTDMSRNTPQTRTLCSFVEDEDLHLCIKSDCADVPFTFCSKSNGSKSSIDHLIVSQNLCEYINKYEAMFMNSDFSDHVPIRLELNINVLHLQTKLRIQKTNVAWHNCSDVHIANYRIELDK